MASPEGTPSMAFEEKRAARYMQSSEKGLIPRGVMQTLLLRENPKNMISLDNEDIRETLLLSEPMGDCPPCYDPWYIYGYCMAVWETTFHELTHVIRGAYHQIEPSPLQIHVNKGRMRIDAHMRTFNLNATYRTHSNNVLKIHTQVTTSTQKQHLKVCSSSVKQQHCFRKAVNGFQNEAAQTQVQHLLQIVQDDMNVGIQNSPMSCKEKGKVKNEYQEIQGMSQLKRSMTQLKEKLQD
ncbi:hypothetical protein RND71_028393 [Anisodus tanguticus]|uniref:Uncharacterized protein n=1 Tax=Anisodus tanguticus TaxID=243964 RepID=A0AAE1RJQ2_9SOLA|nr:hypothetical protein RND71_028393 [Anisodus tanguticus]